jgi:microcystin-dependent protein
MPVNQGVFSVRLGEGSDINEQIPPTVFFDTVANSVRTGVKLAVWFSPDGGTFTRLSPDVDFSSVPYSMVSGIAEAVKERAVTTAMLADAAVTGSKIAPSTIDSSQLAAGGVTGSDIAPGTILASHLDSSFAQDVLNPAGSVIAFAGDVPPAGWLLCDGSQISRGTYARLFAAIGTAHGSGDGATTFHLPDYRGRFLRGVDGLAGRDPDKSSRTAMASGGNTGNLMGTVQNDEIKSHGHSASFTTGNSSADQAGDGNQRPPVRTNPNYNTPRDWGVSVGSTGGSESRPKNANVNYIIKL